MDALQGSATVNQASSRESGGRCCGASWPRPWSRSAGRLRPWLLQIVKACTEVGDGLACLVRSLEYVEQQSATVATLWPLVDEWEAVDFFNNADLRSLRPVLLSMNSPDLATMARRASRSRVQELPPGAGPDGRSSCGCGENSPNGELPPSVAFLALCADRLVAESRADAAEVLRRFTRSQAHALRLDGALADWQHSEFPQAAPSLVPAYLMIQFEPDRVEADRFYLSHWRQSDPEGWHPVRGETVHLRREELPGAVERLIEEVEERWADLRQPVLLEFICRGSC
ncbi:hypothetical protein StrepF001_13440 [Streptomyces sp. F001]|uniref:effector-associated domain 2-containing protein n=1 Tax=Streptomyces sp. F001 TaxID=1510026 RepID=UPI00101E7EDE|nr:hypothetical protein [Streptomyces sp. F001]RZB18150.1 hypothetical protein StrepF001_13440 [Streptomyces sp. F001]